ncbi:hypothetical protein [Alicyclobacillus macrosporangiidus]|uniref:hypothetical protein n=1 Tax=Alicyclobacillus macrosporangiidus TaxID=392015 RepID=UPI0011142FA6|nr:hypothetical protein [Alicyclobacillus macrosporangiidus]
MKRKWILYALSVFGSLVIAGCGTVNDCISVHGLPTTSKPGASMDNTIASIDPKRVGGNHAFDHADSIWRDGSWADPKSGQAGERYVMSFMGVMLNGQVTDPDQPYITVYHLNAAPNIDERVQYLCPRKIGHLTITDITKNGTLIKFVSTKNITGTLDLASGQWTFLSQ